MMFIVTYKSGRVDTIVRLESISYQAGELVINCEDGLYFYKIEDIKNFSLVTE